MTREEKQKPQAYHSQELGTAKVDCWSPSEHALCCCPWQTVPLPLLPAEKLKPSAHLHSVNWPAHWPSRVTCRRCHQGVRTGTRRWRPCPRSIDLGQRLFASFRVPRFLHTTGIGRMGFFPLLWVIIYRRMRTPFLSNAFWCAEGNKSRLFASKRSKKPNKRQTKNKRKRNWILS